MACGGEIGSVTLVKQRKGEGAPASLTGSPAGEQGNETVGGGGCFLELILPPDPVKWNMPQIDKKEVLRNVSRTESGD